MVNAPSRPGDVAAALASLSPDELANTVQTAAERHIGGSRAALLRIYIAAIFDEDEQVARLAGSPSHVIEHLDSQRQQQLVIRSTAHRAILDEPLLESSAVAEALGRSGANGREAASKLRLSGRLVGLKQGNRYLYPAFQLDFDERRVPPVVAHVNQLLDAVRDPWGVASWWITNSSRLGDRAPRDLIGTTEESDLLVLAGEESTE